MLASNPSRNSRPELIADDGQGARLPERPIAWPGPGDHDAGAAVTLTQGQGGSQFSFVVWKAGTPAWVYQK